ncbi:MAG: Uma2 family endonuclease [Salinivenus sp.]
MPSTAASRSDALLSARQRPLTVEEYHRMAEAGILGEDDRVELLDGRLIAMSPIGPDHLHCVNRLNRLLTRRLYSTDPPIAWVSVQNAIQLSDTSEPEPDVTLLRPDVSQDTMPGPDDVLLVVEVADTSADYDRSVKRAHYARAGIPMYWVVDLGRASVDVSWDPTGDTYAERRRYGRGDTLPLPSALDVEPLPVAEVLGPSDA